MKKNKAVFRNPQKPGDLLQEKSILGGNYMKNKHPYRLTDTGIRIPRHKIKWMAPPKGNKSKPLDSPIPASKDFKHLFNSNFDALVHFSESDDLINDEEWKESDQDES